MFIGGKNGKYDLFTNMINKGHCGEQLFNFHYEYNNLIITTYMSWSREGNGS